MQQTASTESNELRSVLKSIEREIGELIGKIQVSPERDTLYYRGARRAFRKAIRIVQSHNRVMAKPISNETPQS